MGNSCCEESKLIELENKIAELQDSVDTLTNAVKVFMCGNPILLITKENDINQFDDNGLGFGCWDGWAICDGKTHINPFTKKPFATDNFTDRFIVQAKGQYEVGDTGGLDEVILTVSQLATHNHGVTDPGHTHNISDPGHLHAIDDAGHVHQAVADPHHHEATLAMGPHAHGYVDQYQDDATIGFITAGPLGTVGYLNSSTPGEVTIASASETHENLVTDNGNGGSATGYTDNATQQITIDNAATGIEIVNALTGITQTESSNSSIIVNNEGDNEAHENRPPYFAAIYVVKMW